ncbi:efflux RND transporter periplasmic adaptor subunit [Paenibacillus sp. YN15]|uniref:efflux RND transporter periplasmic adaptor subunit n=1 Tax=Paenibacillus sp. YN15 TaxID=1742774 RepID=UPI000DCD102F|nr:efflux RND transporter periplasmic adaptor subunit [Paenibacillus sp. YN15]RAV04662.1 efflux RND transporter periplasmic adaptor subunit [Paenibacillus sp. YN15]
MNRIKTNKLKAGYPVAGAMVLAAALLAGCSAESPQQPAAAVESQVKSVKVSPVEKKSIGEPLEQVADISASVQMNIVTKVNGDVLEILKKRGDRVEKGDILFRIDPTDLEIQKEKAQLSIAGTQEQMTKARRDLEDGKQELKDGITKLESALKDAEKGYNKLRNDYDMGLVTKIQLEQTETQLNGLKLDLEGMHRKLQSLESTNSLSQLEYGLKTADVSLRELDRGLSNTEVKATVGGVLTDLPVEVGMTVSPGIPAATVQQLDPVKIKAELTEEAAALVRGKQELSFYVPGSVDKTKATVSYLADVIGAQTKSYSLELTVPNPDFKLKPGSKAQILLTEEQDQIVVTVPTLSVVREGGDTYVFVVNGNAAEKRKVQLGRLHETYQEVLSGIKEGEQLVISGQNQLKDKEPVQIVK